MKALLFLVIMAQVMLGVGEVGTAVSGAPQSVHCSCRASWIFGGCSVSGPCPCTCSCRFYGNCQCFCSSMILEEAIHD